MRFATPAPWLTSAPSTVSTSVAPASPAARLPFSHIAVPPSRVMFDWLPSRVRVSCEAALAMVNSHRGVAFVLFDESKAMLLQLWVPAGMPASVRFQARGPVELLAE